MTWEELKEFAKKYKKFEDVDNRNMFWIGEFSFEINLSIYKKHEFILSAVSYEHMKSIIENLFDEVK